VEVAEGKDVKPFPAVLTFGGQRPGKRPMVGRLAAGSWNRSALGRQMPSGPKEKITMKIIELQAENIKRLKVVRIVPKGNTVQDVQTPPELLRAIEVQFHAHWAFDLAANEQNAVCPYWLGPESRLLLGGLGDPHDSLKVDWRACFDLPVDCFLNPPYSHIEPWVKKAAGLRLGNGRRLFVLVPAAVGSNWYRDHVDGKAHVIALSPRVTFTGHKQGYPKELILAVYSSVRGGWSTWRWK